MERNFALFYFKMTRRDWKSCIMEIYRFVSQLTTPTTTDNSLSPSIKWYTDSNFCLVFKGICFNQKKATFTPPNKTIFLLFMN